MDHLDLPHSIQNPGTSHTKRDTYQNCNPSIDREEKDMGQEDQYARENGRLDFPLNDGAAGFAGQLAEKETAVQGG